MIYLFLFFLMKALRPDGFGVDINTWETLNLLVLVVGCLHYLPVRFFTLYYTPWRQPQNFFWFFAFLGLFILSVWRTNDFVSSKVGLAKDTVTLILLIAFVYLYHQDLFRRKENFSRTILMALVHAMGVFCILNIIAVVANPVFGRESATTLSIVGLHIKRVMFTMYPDVHPNYVGMIGGFLFVMSCERTLFASDSWGKVVRWIYVGAGLTVVLICDSRSNLAAAIISVLAVTWLHRTKSLPLAKYSAWLVPFSSVLFIASLQLLATFSVVQDIARGKNDLATGNSRKFIYQAAANELSDFDPIHLVGFGEYGPYGSGITRYYMSHFGDRDKEGTLNASVSHNTGLQVIFDMGYLGLLVFIIVLYLAMSYATKLYHRGYREYLALLSYFFFNIIAGFTTTRFGNYHEVGHQLFITFCFIIFSVYNYDQLKDQDKKKRSVETGKVERALVSS